MTDVVTKRCPYCAEEVRSEAMKCRWCGSFLTPTPLQRSWQRSREGKRIAGVCAGLAEDFGISVTVLRLAFVLSTLFTGVGIILYVALWVVMPMRSEPRPVTWPDSRPPLSP